MKNLELNHFGVEELNSVEMVGTEGGGLLNSLLGFVIQPVTTAVGTVANDTFKFANKTVGTVLNLVNSL